ncbi:MAG: cupin domain-containing protein [Ruminococcaceae bacterium]|nr:cupin domain-containing protein [Oscillospiraceae bacterium]
MLKSTGLEFKINEITARIRELRGILGYSQADMAAKLSMDEDEYISYESGEEELNFAFLYTCAQVLDVDVTELIEGVTPRLSNYILTRSGEGRRVEQAHGMTYYNLAYKFRDREAEPLFVHAEFSESAQLQPIETTVHEGQEFDIVIRGYLKLQIGAHTEILGPGDTIFYNSSIPHGMIATNGGDCDFYAIVLEPESGSEKKPAAVPAITATRQSGISRIWERFITPIEDGSGRLKSISFQNTDRFNFAFDIVDALGEKQPDKLAMLHIGRDKQETRLTFGQMKKMSARAANYFRSLGIKKGDRVMLVLRRNWQFWPILIGLEKLGAIAIPSVDQLLEKDYAYRFEVAGVTAIICTADGDSTTQCLPAIEKYGKISVKVTTNGKVDGWHCFDEEYDMYSSRFARTDESICGNDPMMMIFTSGSTGYPKLAAHNCKYPLGHFVTARYWHCVDPDGLHLTISDTGWAKAMWGKLFGQWLCEAAVFVYDFDRFSANDIMPMFAKYNITTFCAPPTMYRFFIKEDLSKYDLSSIKHASTAGEAMNPEVFNRFREATGLSIMEAFGQTETTAVVGNFVGMAPRIGSMGKPNPLYRVELLTAEGEPAPDGESGEICIYVGDGAPCGLFAGYYENEKDTSAVWHDGYYHTGDLAWRDEDGYLWYVGRADDLIKSSGYRIGPFEIESVIMELPYVLECGVTSAPDEIRGQAVKACIVLVKGKQGSEELKKEIQNYVKKRTAPYKYPRIVEFYEELPKTASGKILRRML